MREAVFIRGKITQIDWSRDTKPSIYFCGENIDIFIRLVFRMIGLKDV